MDSGNVVLTIAKEIGVPLVTAVGGWVSGYWNGRKKRSDSRVSRVVEKYLTNAEKMKTMGLNGLLVAGAPTLSNCREVNAVISEIVGHGQEHPLGKARDSLRSVDLCKFFQVAAADGLDLMDRGQVDEVIRRIAN